MANETLHSLKEEIESQVKDEARELFEGAYPEDRLHEMADSTVPIYNADLADVLASDPEVATMDDPGLSEGCDDLYRMIAISIYEKLVQHAHSYWEELKEEITDAIQEIEDMSFSDICEDDSGILGLLEVEYDDVETGDASLALLSINPDDMGEDEIDDQEAAQDRLVDAYRKHKISEYWEDL